MPIWQITLGHIIGSAIGITLGALAMRWYFGF